MAIPAPLPRVEAFEKLGLGMFVHWGLYSQLGMGEWTFHVHKREWKDYGRLFDTFTAEDFDADALVSMAKEAGCKYITLTARHHEGFSLYDTKGLTDFDAPHSAAKRDLIREFVDACNRQGILPFFYHTTLDWHNPEYKTDFESYLEYLRRSVEVLCTNYGKIGGFWFDGNWDKPDADWHEDELYATIRRYQPDAIIVNNTGLGARGAVGHPEIDSVTFEQGRPTPMNREGAAKYIAAEMCHTVNDHWGIGHLDLNYQSPKSIIEHLCACRKVGANYLLNVGPTAQGGIEPIQKALFSILGRWMSLFGESIYETKPYGATSSSAKNFALKGEDAVYFFVHDLGILGDFNVTIDGQYSGALAFNHVPDAIERIEWMDNGETLSFIQNGDTLTFTATGYPYGVSTCVRVAKASLKK